MSNPKWHFEKASPNTPQTNPQLGDHFNRDETKNLVSALIRESVQNALDARVSANNPVHISITIGSISSSKLQSHKELLFKNFDPHFKASFSTRKLPDNQLHYWAIEDENTSGLTGDVHTHFEPENEEKRKSERLFFFWKTDGGITNKGGVSKTLGTRGIGKAIFNFSSPLRTFWATSRRATEQDDVLIGRAVLKQHKLNGETYLFRGMYGLNANTLAGEPCTIPAQKAEHIQLFHDTFQLKRNVKSSGTSIVIPFSDPLPGANMALLKERIIEEFGLAVVQGRLTFAISTADGSAQLLKGNIIEKADELDNAGLSELIRLYRDIELNKHQATILPPVIYRQPKTYVESLLGCPSLDQLKIEYAKHRLVIMKIPFPKKTTKLNEDSEWILALQLTELDHSAVLNRFNRIGLDITDEPHQKVRDAHALLFPDDTKLTSILSSSENAAHTKFERGIENFSEHRSEFGWIIAFARNIARNIHDLLAPKAAKIDNTLLARFFPFQSIPGRGESPANGPDSGPTPPPIPPIPQAPQKFVVSPVTALGQYGVKVSNSGLPLQPGEKIKCEFAYSMRGRSFGKHNESDFTLRPNTRGISSIQLKREGTKIPSFKGDNIAIITVNDPKKWSLVFTGFDLNRSLDSRITIVTD